MISTEMGGGLETEAEKWVHDSSVDHRGRTPLRRFTGVWKASLFIIVIEFSERLSYFGLATNLIMYLTKELHEELKTAVKNVNNWTGVTTIMPLLGGFIADAYLGRFSAVLVSSLIYLAGLILLAISQLVPALKPCGADTCSKSLKLHKVVFFIAMYLISVGTGGHKASLESFGADQFDDGHAGERRRKMSFFNWWNFALCCGLLVGVTVIAYIQDNVSWGASSIILALVMTISLAIFLVGRPFYRYRAPQGSPFTPMLKVLVAAAAKRNLPLPSNNGDLFESPVSQNSKRRRLCHTNRLRFLDRAAIVENTNNDVSGPTTESLNQWRLATVTQVEELKLILSMVPIWLASLPFGICTAQGATLFVKQGSTMNRKIAGGFEIPPASVYSLAALSMIVSVSFYDRVLVPFMRRVTGHERGITILQRMGVGMVFTALMMVVAAIVEGRRLRVAEAEQRAGVVSMSVFWLVPQFALMGWSDGFTLVGLQEYFYDQVPDGMRSLGIALYLSVMGTASFLSSLLITVVDKMTEKGGSEGWFAKDLNRSRLDLFYWLLAAIITANLFAYVYVANKYSYKRVQAHERAGTSTKSSDKNYDADADGVVNV